MLLKAVFRCGLGPPGKYFKCLGEDEKECSRRVLLETTAAPDQMIWGAFLWRFSFDIAVQADPSNAAVVPDEPEATGYL